MAIEHPRGAVFPGPFLTRRDAARLAGVSPGELAAMPGAVRIAGPLSLEEAYPQFQFAPGGGFVPGLPDVVEALGAALSGRARVAWLLAGQAELGGASPVEWLTRGGRLGPVRDLVAGEVRRAA